MKGNKFVSTGGICIPKKMTLMICFSFFIFMSIPVSAVLVIEDFQDDTDPSLPGLTSSVFQHTFLPLEGDQPGDENWTFADMGQRLPYVLLLAPAVDEVVFSIEPDQYVNYASVKLINMDTDEPAIVEFIGTLDTLRVVVTDWMDPGEPFDAWPLVDTSGSALGEITKIKLMGSNAAFDNLSINIVPEPSTLLLLFCGAVGFRKFSNRLT